MTPKWPRTWSGGELGCLLLIVFAILAAIGIIASIFKSVAEVAAVTPSWWAAVGQGDPQAIFFGAAVVYLFGRIISNSSCRCSCSPPAPPTPPTRTDIL